MNIKGIIVVTISIAVFDLLLMQLKKLDSKALWLFYRIPEKWKGKWQIKWISILILLLGNAYIKVYFRLNDIFAYIIAGFIVSLCDFALIKTQEEYN